jgi:hypothetical protein
MNIRYRPKFNSSSLNTSPTAILKWPSDALHSIKALENRLWKNPRILAEIQRRLDLIDKEIARLLVEIATSG